VNDYAERCVGAAMFDDGASTLRDARIWRVGAAQQRC